MSQWLLDLKTHCSKDWFAPKIRSPDTNREMLCMLFSARRTVISSARLIVDGRLRRARVGACQQWQKHTIPTSSCWPRSVSQHMVVHLKMLCNPTEAAVRHASLSLSVKLLLSCSQNFQLQLQLSLCTRRIQSSKNWVLYWAQSHLDVGRIIILNTYRRSYLVLFVKTQ